MIPSASPTLLSLDFFSPAANWSINGGRERERDSERKRDRESEIDDVRQYPSTRLYVRNREPLSYDPRISTNPARFDLHERAYDFPSAARHPRIDRLFPAGLRLPGRNFALQCDLTTGRESRRRGSRVRVVLSSSSS